MLFCGENAIKRQGDGYIVVRSDSGDYDDSNDNGEEKLAKDAVPYLCYCDPRPYGSGHHLSAGQPGFCSEEFVLASSGLC